ncbi:MAG: flavodoxin family protein [Methanosphaera sp.]|uniref:flavodoxin family protein n=1 Tax=Methanosphaera sp. TaxID=2666342 RepID=UPI0025D54BCE|nr:flavodoxin family protein [Methanosphaera sp.]MCI5867217.1 flavodoxin family protein [Methanosphaera sp.]MDD6534715.1 flavodoxin family protein [Methanosphaera sp.]MDY3955617.1 flavodoxin family protein [Methanosphaera sp.]
MKIIGITSSPRGKGSNSTTALNLALDVAKDNGADVEIFDLTKMNIADCQGDDYCKSHNGECPVNDDMQQLYSALKECDGVVLASPIYFFDLTGITRIFIDRLYAFYLSTFPEEYKGKKFSIITTQEIADEDEFRASAELAAKGFESLGFKIMDIECFGDVNEPNSLSDEQIKRAQKLGENLL